MLVVVLGLVAADLKLRPDGYFIDQGVNVMSFDDIYPEGHQGGVALIMHANRVASNGDLRLEHTPGQWQPIPVMTNRIVDTAHNRIIATLRYPDEAKHMIGFNPIIYPDIQFVYNITVQGVGSTVEVTVDLDRAIPSAFVGKVGYNLEFFPGSLFGKPYLMDNTGGFYPRQPNGPTKKVPTNIDKVGNWNPAGKANLSMLIGEDRNQYNPMVADDIIAEPYAKGKSFISRPDEPLARVKVDVLAGGDLELYDGRMNHNNGWFVLRSAVPAGAKAGAIKWRITPSVVSGWQYKPVVQTSQVGYHPRQHKVAIIELDGAASGPFEAAELQRIGAAGAETVQKINPVLWNKAFLRYKYLKVDFSDVVAEGLYQVKFQGSVGSMFKISETVYDRGVWQPALEYFLPHQMCHMKVMEKYRVWHGHCHKDDARMAPINYNHIDGYEQGPSTLCKYAPEAHIPNQAEGGWHDAGDYDLRVESQAGETYQLALAWLEFKPDYDQTAIDWEKHTVEIHQPDGIPDLVQQVRHGAKTVVNCYKEIGRLYRGISTPLVRPYVLLGEAIEETEGVDGKTSRWLFTEQNPARELETAAQLAAISRALRVYYPKDADDAHAAAVALYNVTPADNAVQQKLQAATELFLLTSEQQYLQYVLNNQNYIFQHPAECAWFVARIAPNLGATFVAAYHDCLAKYTAQINEQRDGTPYGITYEPYIWGHAWDADMLAVKYYYLWKYDPALFDKEYIYATLNFVLGVHPGLNTASYASGVGAKSAIPQYTNNRADWGYVPGGVISGTALIRPDFPELLEWPFLWQQTEVVMNTGSSAYMFLSLAVANMVKQ